MSILDLNTQERIEFYEYMTGKKLVNMFDLEEFVFMQMVEEI